MAGLMAQGPLPAGMLRIRLGQQERYVWPVHLPGWQSLGWRVAGAESMRPESPGVGAPAPGLVAPEPLAEMPPALDTAEQNLEQEVEETKPTRGRRGRPRKEKTEAAAEPVAAPPVQEPDGDETATGTGDKPAAEPAAALGADDSSDLVTESDAYLETELTSLPDDLFDDPLL